jgi:IclR family acetate operon transcriptional repressor
LPSSKKLSPTSPRQPAGPVDHAAGGRNPAARGDPGGDGNPASGGAGGPQGGVQSIVRVFRLLEDLADLGGMASLSSLQTRSGLPLPTVHRLVRTLVALGYVRQDKSRDYALAPRLARLGESANRLAGIWARPYLQRLVEHLGESANLAVLDGGQVLYVAHCPGRHSMRMFTEVGRRAGAHCTAVGKAMLAQLPEEEAAKLLSRSGMPAQTANTLTQLPAMLGELRRVRQEGFALDNGEQEDGVRCVAVALPGKPGQAALSISAPSSRMDEEMVKNAVPLLQLTAKELANELQLANAEGLAQTGPKRQHGARG